MKTDNRNTHQHLASLALDSEVSTLLLTPTCLCDVDNSYCYRITNAKPPPTDVETLPSVVCIKQLLMNTSW